ncbi:MAG: hypothetical protein FWC89_10860 [Defluviitaleaceae bacterium]|nr:hypothetical protein [Defluviitaleaceae bacterium]
MTAARSELLNYDVDITNEEEFHKFIEEGLEDVRQGRVQPFKDAMREIRQELAQYGV